jgi:predicted DNA-binding transcriptional regulator YafY
MSNHKKAQGTSLERAVRLIVKLLSSRNRVDFESLSSDEWGSYSNLMKFLKAINETWSLHSGNELFEVIDENGEPWQRGRQRYLRLADASLKGASAANLAIMPVFLQFLKMLRGTYLEKGFLELYGEGTAQLKEAEKQFLRSTSRKFFYAAKGLKDYSMHSERVEALYHAVLSEHLIEVQRARRDKTKVTSRLAPLTIVLFNNGLYLIAHDADSDRPKPLIFRVETFEKVRPLAKGFKYPSDYSPEALLRDAFGLHHEDGVRHVVEIQLLDESVVEYVRSRRWSSDDEYFTLDGRTCLRFQTSSLVEVASWVLSFGPSVRVLGPAELRQDVAERAARLHALYGEPPGRRSA